MRHGVHMVKCNINNREECCRAFAGAYGVYAITNYWNATDGDEYKQALNLIEAARVANVQHFITSGIPDTAVFEKNQFDLPLHCICIPFYDVHDTGKVVRECFQHPERWGHGQTVPIAAEQLTMEEICATIREVSGKDIRFVPLSCNEALVKLHRETVDNLRWYNDFGSIDERQAEKTKEIYGKMKTFAEWVRETQWLME
ncbi:unnamed protein product [Rotaria sp. Silwood2]|nr:unnamed protein product [Rotaria sp. Silwood2]CAF2833903.1 unnamed protein product [Rotaria sp. Silwood2]CAF3116663.1 unnamed protein product [Rotaria sp. Silwood2]CAF4206440.1 unnamed protein product [Rotaria sp. Silwood2]CAF4612143.1 unnamed protein product [Rotaria sp. Silwood2]